MPPWAAAGKRLRGRTQARGWPAAAAPQPNGGCSAVGAIGDGAVDLTRQLSNPGNPALSGVLTFHGAVAPDAVVRGAVVHSKTPGTTGQAAMMRI
jgi:hypothetical protein